LPLPVMKLRPWLACSIFFCGLLNKPFEMVGRQDFSKSATRLLRCIT
jgi:hypothetical protein